MRTTILVVGGVLALAACGNSAVADEVKELPDPPTTTEAPALEPVTDDEIDLIALDAAWTMHKAEICPAYDEALDTGVDPDILAGLAVRTVAEGWGEPLSPAMEARLLELIDEC